MNCAADQLYAGSMRLTLLDRRRQRGEGFSSMVAL
jgi:hypothetical protein